MTATATATQPRFQPEIVGPYSKWPRRNWKTPAAVSATAVAAAAFVHCVVPLMA